MKIVHLCLSAPYNDNWGYQDNLLPKSQKLLGNEVTVITQNAEQKDGKIVKTDCREYISAYGVKIIRIAPEKILSERISLLMNKFDIYDILKAEKPDLIFSHGLLTHSMDDVIKYKKLCLKSGTVCAVVQDNHLDCNIANLPHGIVGYLIRLWRRSYNRKTQMYVDKVYGVTPWRKQFAEEYFGISPQKTDVLIMGADDENIKFARKAEIRTEIRQRYGVTDKDFLIVTGGKIDRGKQIHLLMQACGELKNVKLIVFGSVSENIKAEYDKLVKEYNNIIAAGWIDAKRVYDYFLAAELAVFPGGHSVLWEQACASKIPCVFKKWPGMWHVDNGGNAELLDNVTVESLKDEISSLVFTPKYTEMKKIAESEATDIYLYSRIAEKSLECAK